MFKKTDLGRSHHNLSHSEVKHNHGNGFLMLERRSYLLQLRSIPSAWGKTRKLSGFCFCFSNLNGNKPEWMLLSTCFWGWCGGWVGSRVQGVGAQPSASDVKSGSWQLDQALGAVCSAECSRYGTQMVWVTWCPSTYKAVWKHLNSYGSRRF